MSTRWHFFLFQTHFLKGVGFTNQHVWHSGLLRFWRYAFQLLCKPLQTTVSHNTFIHIDPVRCLCVSLETHNSEFVLFSQISGRRSTLTKMHKLLISLCLPFSTKPQPWTGSPPLAINGSLFLPSQPPSSPGKPAEWRLPPPLDKWAIGEGSCTLCGGEETIIHGENGVTDEEEWNEGTAAFPDESGGWSLTSEIQREEWLWFVEAGAQPVQSCMDKENLLGSYWL